MSVRYDTTRETIAAGRFRYVREHYRRNAYVANSFARIRFTVTFSVSENCDRLSEIGEWASRSEEIEGKDKLESHWNNIVLALLSFQVIRLI